MGRRDKRLYGAWIPEPSGDDAVHAVSLVIEAERIWFVGLQHDGFERSWNEYRLTRGDRIVMPTDHGWRGTSVRYAFDSDGALIWNGRRYTATTNPTDRAWPPELEG